MREPRHDRQHGDRHIGPCPMRHRRCGGHVQRHIQQPLHDMGQIQKETIQDHTDGVIPVPPHTDGRCARRRIPQCTTGGDRRTSKSPAIIII